MSEFKSYKWITSEINSKGKSIQVHNVSQAFGPVATSPCNIISIFGRARQGKSFLMNCLAGERDIFRISNEKESCTQGIDISNKWLGLSEFSRIDGGKSMNPKAHEMKIGFVDAEGQGDKDISYDADLICPILLASKCVIFNWKGDLQKDHILSTLGIMTRAARNVATDSSESSSSSSMKPSASTAALSGSDPHVVRKKFGHLHIVFRDWQSVGSDEASTFNALFGIENTSEGSVRDQIRADVLDSFESIRVWLFDAPSDYVADLKKKLTIDKTSVVFRGQVRNLRNALSSQLRDPTYLYGNQPLLGRSFNPMISLVAESLNRGEVVLPSSAYLSMMRMEMDKIRRDYEDEMRSSMENLLNEIDGICVNGLVSRATTTAVSLYPTEKKATEQLDQLFEKIGFKYNGEMEKTLGSLTSAISKQILSEYPAQIERVNSTLREQFSATFRNRFSKWLLSARKKAQNAISESCAGFTSRTEPVANAGVESFLQETFQSAVSIMGGSAVYGVENEEVKDAEEVLSRHLDGLALEVRGHNQYLIAESRKHVSKYLVEATTAMAQTLTDTVSGLRTSQPTGYVLKILEDVLNKRFFELRDLLIKNCRKNFHTDALVSEFKQFCGGMREKMLTEYAQARQSAYHHGVQEARKLGETRFLDTADVEFDRTVHNEDWLFDHFNTVIAQVKRHVNNTVAGWGGSVLGRDQDNDIIPGDADYIAFENDLSETLQAIAMNISVSVAKKWADLIEVQDAVAAEIAEQKRQEEEVLRKALENEERMRQVRLKREREEAAAVEAAEAEELRLELEREEQERQEQELQERATVVMEQSDDEVEEVDDEEEDVYNKSGVKRAARPIAAGGAEQRKRAQDWATANLAPKPVTKRGTAASRAKAEKLLHPDKTVEQQRADAAEFAKRLYGDNILDKTPTNSAEKAPKRRASGAAKRGVYSDDEEDEEVYDETNRRATLVSAETAALRANAAASGSGGGLFTNVRSWFGAPVQQEEPAEEEYTPKKGASSSSSGINESKTPASVKKETIPVVFTTTATPSAKPLTALQQAKADAKKAEADRVANMVVTKKGGKKG